MLIYAVADIHGRAARLDTIRENVERFQPDVLVVAGDLVTLFGMDRVLERLDALGLPVLVVKGNGDRFKTKSVSGKYQHIDLLNLDKVSVKGADFVGIGGTVPIPFNSKIALREGRIFDRLSTLVDEDSIVIAHPPPKGVLDQVFFGLHAGCAGLSRLIESSRPKLVICGHIHENAGEQKTGRTIVVNCSIGRQGAGALIKIQNQTPPEVEMLT